MLKNKIYRYFTAEILKSFLTILFAFTTIAWTVRAVNFLDLIVEDGHSVITYLSFSLFNITNIITKFIPLAFLLSLILSLIKFERQNELIILWTTGLNKIKLVNLLLYVSIIVLVIQLLFATFITPSLLNKSRTIIKTSGLESISSVVKTNDFSDSLKGVTFYVDKIEDNMMKNIFIRDENQVFKSIISEQKNSNNTTIIAQSGFFKDSKLIMFNGLIQTQKLDGEINNINFEKTTLLLDQLASRSIILPKLQETSTLILINCVFRKDNFEILLNCPKNVKKDVVETISRRLGMPFYIPLITLISSFLLVANRKNKKKSSKPYLYFLISFLILIWAEIFVRYSGFSFFSFITYFITPIVLLPITYFILLKSMRSEKIKK